MLRVVLHPWKRLLWSVIESANPIESKHRIIVYWVHSLRRSAIYASILFLLRHHSSHRVHSLQRTRRTTLTAFYSIPDRRRLIKRFVLQLRTKSYQLYRWRNLENFVPNSLIALTPCRRRRIDCLLLFFYCVPRMKRTKCYTPICGWITWVTVEFLYFKWIVTADVAMKALSWVLKSRDNLRQWSFPVSKFSHAVDLFFFLKLCKLYSGHDFCITNSVSNCNIQEVQKAYTVVRWYQFIGRRKLTYTDSILSPRTCRSSWMWINFSASFICNQYELRLFIHYGSFRPIDCSIQRCYRFFVG